VSFSYLPSVLAEVDELANRFAAADRSLFLVGGIVRDLWLDTPLCGDSDIDLTTDARPTEIKEIVGDWADALWTQGERFGTIGCEKDGRSIEVTTFRAEVYVPDSRKPEVAFGDDIFADLARRDFTVNAMAYEIPVGELIDPHNGVADLAARRLVAFGDDIFADLARRDFTVNAMAYEIPVGELIDPHDGVADLAARRLRTPLAPSVSFTDDPLRMIRAARFANRYRLEPTPELLEAAHTLRERLDIVAIERIRDELEKLLSAEDVRVGLDVLHSTGLLERIVPGAGSASVDLASRTPAPWWLRTAALVLPVVEAGALQADVLRGLKLSKHDERAIGRTITSALELDPMASAYAPGDPAVDEAIRTWVVGAKGNSESAWTLATARFGEVDLAHFGARMVQLAKSEDLTSTDVALTGQDICTLLDIEPGPQVGEAMKALQAHRLRTGPFHAAEAATVLRAWAAAEQA